MLNPTDFGRELAYPLTNVSLLLSWLLLFLIVEAAVNGGFLGLLLLLMVLPSLFRYLMRILESRAKGQDPGSLTVDDLLWIGNSWSLFIVVHFAVLIYATYLLGSLYGLAGMLLADTLLAAVIPASLAVLAITRSPWECLKPRAIVGVIDRCGIAYWLLPTYFVIVAGLLLWLSTRSISGFLLELFSAYLVVTFFVLIGTVVRPHNFHNEVGLHDPVEPDQEVLDEKLLEERTAVISHAYGFISRDNRTGGFKHIDDWLARDPLPDDAWQWFFDRMMRWEIKDPALLFAQSYLTRLLHDGEYEKAVKVLVRCRFVNEAFLPLPDDRALALQAAEYCQNEELIAVLGRC